MPDEEVLHNVMKFVQGMKSFTITVKFNDKEIPSVDDASDELLTHCVRHCHSLRRFTVHRMRYQERKLYQCEAHSFFVRRVTTWTGVTENSDGTLSLAGREDMVEHH
ncbi:hypothetical protein EXIGLDRAFT_817419 [Exidia glandulosa HHB12029]|uniref:Uncharacterized protein n=1 Tax=Exidia glandulosa HHB12029 TaxID=1314781 RepID=A0A165KFM5_EXIGL|nr:hypothetical protein EXIGLDRAFT_817419 [Exidia glandulosa HHB12029]